MSYTSIISRSYQEQALRYSNSTDPTQVIDKRNYAMICVGPLPAACNGLTMSVLAAGNGLAAGLAIPKIMYSGGTLTAFSGVTVSTGDIIIIQAEIAAVPWFGLRFSSAITATIPVWLMG